MDMLNQCWRMALILFAAASPASVRYSNHYHCCLLFTLYDKVIAKVVTVEERKDWLEYTYAKLTFVGEPIDLSKRNTLNTIIVQCLRRSLYPIQWRTDVS